MPSGITPLKAAVSVGELRSTELDVYIPAVKLMMVDGSTIFNVDSIEDGGIMMGLR